MMRISISISMAVLGMLWTGLLSSAAAESSVEVTWMDVRDDPSTRAEKLLAQMTLEEKIEMVHGVPGEYVGNVRNNTRLNIPALLMNDGPQGFRCPAQLGGTTTAWPSGLTIGATWDTQLAYAWGQAMGQEFWDKGANVQLGPGVNVARVPRNGRNFEYISGEDPVLGATMVAPVIAGIQSKKVIATVKHYVLNNQETNRDFVSANVDERTQWEIYYPPFEAAVRAGVLATMCSYNKINNVWACQNNITLNTDLKARMGYKYWVMSDWGATHTTELAAVSGLDQEMPEGFWFGVTLAAAVKAGTVSEGVVNDKVLRILTAMFTAGIFDTARTGDIHRNVTSVDHNQLARTLAASATVLLKNANNTLPISLTSANAPVRTIAVIGDWAVSPHVGGQGSGYVSPPYIITPLLGITVRAGSGVRVVHVGSSDIAGAVQAARQADVAIVVTGTDSSEGLDRKDLSLPAQDDTLIAQVAAAQPRTVAVVLSPGAVLMPWAPAVGAALHMFMPGQEAGNALADVLFGDVNPSGRLPLTMPNVENEIGFTQRQYPGLPASRPADAFYDEKLEIGYRWYHAHSVTPRFPFGHGLSYTTFTYSKLALTPATDPSASIVVSFTLTNTGRVAGSEITQVYLDFPAQAQVNEPPRQLKAFQKVSNLAVGAAETVKIIVPARAVQVWDADAHGWARVAGQYVVHVGASSADLRLQGSITL